MGVRISWLICPRKTDFAWVASSATVRASGQAQIESLWRFNAKFRPRWAPRYIVLGSVSALPRRGLVIADAEGITELPVVGRFFGRNAS